ncbi:MAG: LacI family DNA-binding transcriptional regulator [Halocynthiibacter sp.]
MSTQKEIARELGISVATVSNALTGKGRVSEELVEQVKSCAARLGYTPSAAGRALKSGRSGILGLVMPDITHPVFPDFAHGLEIEADSKGFGILIANGRGSAEGQEKAIKQLIKRGVDGIVMIPQRKTSPIIPTVPSATISTVSDPNYTVASNHVQGGALSAQAILDLGHKSVLLIGDDPDSLVQQDRILGMTQTLQGNAVSSVIWNVDELPDFIELFRMGITAILTVSDLLAVRALAEIRESGLKCPDHFSVIGFDDLPLARAIRPQLSTVVSNTAQLSKHAIEYLDAKIGGAALPAPTVIDMSIALRGTTAAAPNTENS